MSALHDRSFLLSVIGAGRADASTNVPADDASGVASRDVVEGSLVGLSVPILFIELGERSSGRRRQLARSIDNAGEGGRGPTGAADFGPALQVNRGAAEVRCYVGKSALRANDVRDDVLVARPLLIDAETTAATAGVVLLVDEVALIIAVKERSADGDQIWRSGGVRGNVQAGVA